MSGPAGTRGEEAPLLSVRDLRVSFGTKRGTARVVNGVSYDIDAGETLAIVGESGSGKSVSTHALMGLVPRPPATVTGEVLYEGRNLLNATDGELRGIRGRHLAMIFQDPMTSLNPVLTIGRQMTEGMELHLGLSEADARRRAVELLELVGLPAAEGRLDSYPHQFSGGMRQRVMIAMGLAAEPRILIADEPTTALDVTIQAQIVELVARLQRELGMAVIWITHDLGVVAGIADRVIVLYAGRVVEQAGVDALYDAPRHPYTRGLLASLPVLGPTPEGEERKELTAIPGLPPDPTGLPPGCPFWPRCPERRDERCRTEEPPLRGVSGDATHRIAAFYEVADG
ncbi:MAG TPA: ABC transporter ATP-binding protein [Egibacteraceae bacterium]|nr:ABC transporter ATP-binding protein [Egibacteraceae bacterium]